MFKKEDTMNRSILAEDIRRVVASDLSAGQKLEMPEPPPLVIQVDTSGYNQLFILGAFFLVLGVYIVLSLLGVI